VGDELYGVADERLMLHATYLEFIHPVTGNVLRVHSDAAFNGVDE
jgi:tRNA pseudouridine32 synthase/23S rRNA pseudouridine746 synthase